MNRLRKKIYFMSILAIIPASLLGIMGMIYNEVLSSIWLQNLLAIMIGAAVTYFLGSRKAKINDAIIAVTAIILLILTFGGEGLEGVHRWIKLAVINVNVSMIVLPITLAAVYHLLENKRLGYASSVITAVTVLLFLQPDASQLTGFTIPTIIFMYEKKIHPMIRYSLSALLTCLMLLSWIFIDQLAPVSYVEGILGLLNNISPIWMAAGLSSLFLIPLPYILSPPAKYRVLSICIGLYYCIIILSSLYGHFPVPIMGYGISPIFGYFIIYTWYIRTKTFTAQKLD